MAKLHFCVTKVKAPFNRCCSSRLAVFTNWWMAVTEQSEARGQIELQIGECEIVPTVVLRHGGWVRVRVCVWGGQEKSSRQAVELPSYHLAVQGHFAGFWS